MISEAVSELQAEKRAALRETSARAQELWRTTVVAEMEHMGWLFLYRFTICEQAVLS